MKKSLIAMAVAGAMLAPAANAATTLYGQVEEAWVDSDKEVVTLSEVASSEDAQKHRSNTRVGIKGSEDLGNGLSAIFQIETQVKDAGGPRDSGSTWNADRNTFVGLKGSFGTILAGRHDTPEKISTSFLDKFDATGLGPYYAIMANTSRINGLLAYISPNFSGITFGAAVAPGEGDFGERDGFPAEVVSGWADAYYAMIKYKNGPLSVGIGHTGYEVPNTGLGSTDAESTRFGIHWGQGNFDVGAAYQQVDDGGNESDAWYLTGKYKFNRNYILLGYGTRTYDSFGDPEKTSFGIEFGHNFSKRTKVYLAHGNTESDKYDAGTGVVTSTENTVISVGLKHKF